MKLSKIIAGAGLIAILSSCVSVQPKKGDVIPVIPIVQDSYVSFFSAFVPCGFPIGRYGGTNQTCQMSYAGKELPGNTVSFDLESFATQLAQSSNRVARRMSALGSRYSFELKWEDKDGSGVSSVPDFYSVRIENHDNSFRNVYFSALRSPEEGEILYLRGIFSNMQPLPEAVYFEPKHGRQFRKMMPVKEGAGEVISYQGVTTNSLDPFIKSITRDELAQFRDILFEELKKYVKK